ncbi:MAG: AAA family ATPase, partial [Pseudomonadota bacterium]
GERQHPAARFCHRCGKPAPGETSEPIEIERVMATARDEGSSVQVDRTMSGAAIVIENGMRFVEFEDVSGETSLELSVDRVGPGAHHIEAQFHGRATELATARAALERALQGATQSVQLVGDVGMGKTRTLREIAAMAENLGFVVARATGGRFGVPVSLDLFRQWVVSLCDRLGELRGRGERASSCKVGEALAWVHALKLPPVLCQRLEQLFDGTATQVTTNALDARQRQLGALFSFLELLTRGAPLCLLADDLALADPLSLALAEALAQRLPDARLILVSAVTGAQTERLSTTGSRLPLPPLAVDDMVPLAESFLHHGALPAALVPVLRDGARGTPLLIVHQMQVLLDAQALTFEDPHWILGAVDPGFIITQARDVTRERSEILLPGVIHVLRVAAVTGQAFSRALLEAACVGQGVDVYHAVDEAMGRGLLVSLGQSRQWQCFSHNSSRGHLLEGVSEAALRRVHLTLATAYDRSDELPRPLAQELVARHLLLSDAGDKALPHLAAAAQSLFERGLPEQAAEMVIQLLRAAMQTPRGPLSESQSVFLLQQCSVATRALRQIDPQRASGILASLLDRLPREHAPVERARALRYRALAQMALDRVKDAQTTLDVALRLLPDDSDAVVRAMVGCEIATLQARRGAAQEAAAGLAAALATLGNHALPSVESSAERLGCLTRAYLTLSEVYATLQRHDYALQAASRARDLARGTRQAHLELRALLHLAQCEQQAGNSSSAHSLLEQAQALAELQDDPSLSARATLAQAQILLEQADARLGSLVGRSQLTRASLLRTYAALQAAGVEAHSAPARQGSIPPSPAQALGNMAFDAARLAEAVDLDEAAKKRVLYYSENLEYWNHFELFGVGNAATTAEIRTAYFLASKLFHPDNFFRKNLGSYGPRIESVFKAMKQAYAVLSDDSERESYEAGLVWNLREDLHRELMDLGASRDRAWQLLATCVRQARLADETEVLQIARGLLASRTVEASTLATDAAPTTKASATA